MKLEEVVKIIKNFKGEFRIFYDKVWNRQNEYIIITGYFPDDSEIPFISEDFAWEFAKQFAKSVSRYEYCNIRVVDEKYRPTVPGKDFLNRAEINRDGKLIIL